MAVLGSYRMEWAASSRAHLATWPLASLLPIISARGVVLLGLGEHLTEVIYWALDHLLLALFLAFHHQDNANHMIGGGDVH
jgi:hypothetical protein